MSMLRGMWWVMVERHGGLPTGLVGWGAHWAGGERGAHIVGEGSLCGREVGEFTYNCYVYLVHCVIL